MTPRNSCTREISWMHALMHHRHIHICTLTRTHIDTYLSLLTPEALEKVVETSTVPKVLIAVSQLLHHSAKNMLSFKVS